jgi:hypothetical protein
MTLSATTVTEQGAFDTLTGGGGHVRYWADLAHDSITNLNGGDQVQLAVNCRACWEPAQERDDVAAHRSVGPRKWRPSDRMTQGDRQLLAVSWRQAGATALSKGPGKEEQL